MLDDCAWGSVCVEIAVLGCEEGCCVGKAVGRVVGGEIKVREGLIRGRSGVHLLVEEVTILDPFWKRNNRRG